LVPARDKLVTKTSSGYAFLLFDGAGRGSGLVLGVDSYDDSGWVNDCGQWRSDAQGPPLAEFLQKTLTVPQAEAEALAVTVRTKWVPEWERSGGRERSEQLSHGVTFLLTAIAVLVLLALLGIVLAVFLLIG
jgi:predicted neutral ceramidase superfamily lipid hydrolase